MFLILIGLWFSEAKFTTKKGRDKKENLSNKFSY